VTRAPRALALVSAAAVAALALGAASAPSADRDLPPGWRQIERPISGVTYPRQVLAAATYPVTFARPPRGCRPAAALNQMPAAGVLLQIIEYAPTDPAGKPLRIPRLPRRPHRFSYSDATYARFECAGPSYKFTYRQAGHALQAQVWMKRESVDPRRRAEALRILDQFEPAG
jgi:hypothetical protein